MTQTYIEYFRYTSFSFRIFSISLEMPYKRHANLSRALILSGISTEKELAAIITGFVTQFINEEKRLQKELTGDLSHLEDSIAKLAWQAELKIQIKQMKKMKEVLLRIMKTSQNRMILATVEMTNEIN